MISFSCRVCQRALYIHEVGFWAGGHSFCGAVCLGQVDTEALTATQPLLSVRGKDLAHLIRVIAGRAKELGTFCKSLSHETGIPLAEAATVAAFATGIGAGAALFGLAVSSAQESQAQRAKESLQDGFLDLEEQLSVMVRHFMAFHEAGHPIPQTLSQVLQTCGGLDAHNPADSYSYLVTLFDQLEFLSRHVRSLQLSPQPKG